MFQRFIEVWVPLIENDPALFIIIVGACAVVLTIDLAALVLIVIYIRSAHRVRQNVLRGEEQMPHVREWLKERCKNWSQSESTLDLSAALSHSFHLLCVNCYRSTEVRHQE
jgi:hypothetical protein